MQFHSRNITVVSRMQQACSIGLQATSAGLLFRRLHNRFLVCAVGLFTAAVSTVVVTNNGDCCVVVAESDDNAGRWCRSRCS